MKGDNKVEYLVVDTTAFIKNAPIQDIAENVLTVQDVVDEITNKRQLRRLVVLPYDLVIKDVFPENVKYVTEFSKKTGDYPSLSATDIKVIALTYQLEKEKVGIQHLKDIPSLPVAADVSLKALEDHLLNVAGFFLPRKDKNDNDDDDDEVVGNGDGKNVSEDETNESKNEVKIGDENIEECEDISEQSSLSDYETANSDVESIEGDSLADRFSTLECKPEDLEVEGDKDVDDILARSKNNDCSNKEREGNDCEDEDGVGSGDEYDDEEGWITPGNILKVKKQMDSDIQEEKPAKVACLTTDFAMQNVLKQIGLQVSTIDGRVIKQLRTFILRCYSCFKTTSIMTKEFCPKCGNRTLKKVAVSLDENGKQQIHINFKKPLTARGKKFSLPTPQGGKHARNPILFEDQPRPDERPTRLAKTKNDPLKDEYIAGYSPFVMRDLNSKSAMLGIRSGVDVKHWMRKNPNQATRVRK